MTFLFNVLRVDISHRGAVYILKKTNFMILFVCSYGTFSGRIDEIHDEFYVFLFSGTSCVRASSVLCIATTKRLYRRIAKHHRDELAPRSNVITAAISLCITMCCFRFLSVTSQWDSFISWLCIFVSLAILFSSPATKMPQRCCFYCLYF